MISTSNRGTNKGTDIDDVQGWDRTLWFELCLLKIYVEILTSDTCERDLICHWGLQIESSYDYTRS